MTRVTVAIFLGQKNQKTWLITVAGAVQDLHGVHLFPDYPEEKEYLSGT